MNVQTKKLLNGLLDSVGDMALKRRARMIVEEINPLDNDKILDVGCGDGYYLHLLSSLGLRLQLYGTDFDVNALNSASKNLSGRKVKITQADLMGRLPYKSNYFDKIVMSEVLEHLPSDIKGLQEVKRVLKPGGVLLITVPNARYPFLWDPVNWLLEHLLGAHFRSGFWAGIWNQHHRLYKKEDLITLSRDLKMRVKRCEATTLWSLPFNHYLMNFAAVKLHSGGFSSEVSAAINKFNSLDKKPIFIRLAYMLVNFVDKLNDYWPSSTVGVGVLVKLQK